MTRRGRASGSNASSRRRRATCPRWRSWSARYTALETWNELSAIYEQRAGLAESTASSALFLHRAGSTWRTASATRSGDRALPRRARRGPEFRAEPGRPLAPAGRGSVVERPRADPGNCRGRQRGCQRGRQPPLPFRAGVRRPRRGRRRRGGPAADVPRDVTGLPPSLVAAPDPRPRVLGHGHGVPAACPGGGLDGRP